MKKWLLVMLSLLCLLAAACGPKQQASQAEPVDRPEFDAPTFYLDRLPDLPAFSGLPGEISARYYEEAYIDTLQPSDDYGQLYPYIGKVLYDNSFVGSDMRNGLVDARGRIVVDPVYSWVSYGSTGPEPDTDYLTLTYPLGRNDVKAQRIARDTDFYVLRRHFQFASSDGSWVSPIFYGDSATLSGDRVIITLNSDDPEEVWTARGFRSQIFDLDGVLLSEVEGSLFGFSEDLTVLQRQVNIDGQNTAVYSYLDKDGQVVIEGPFSSASNFHDGQAMVSLENGAFYAIIDKQGNYIVEPKHIGDAVYWYEGNTYFPFYENGKQGMIDRQGNVVLPAVYNYISFLYGEEDNYLLSAHKFDGTYDIIDLRTGQIEPADETITYVSVEQDNWLIMQAEDRTSGSYPPPDQYLKRGEKEYTFLGSEYGRIYLRYMADDIFVINDNNDPDGIKCSVSFFDAGSGEIIKTWPDWMCYNYVQTPQGKVYYLDNWYTQKAFILSEDFEPLFKPESMAGASAFNEIRHLKDDLYTARTARYSGLLRADGSWLIRVTVQNQD